MYLLFLKYFLLMSMSLIPSSDSTPELRSIHQEFVLNAL